MVKPALETLRAIFREEFDDMLALLRQQIERALEDPSGAADELRRAVHTLKGASRAAADHVQVEGTMYTYNTQKWGFEGLGGDILGVGVSGTLAASKRHVDDPPLVSWKKTGTEFVEAERRGLQNLDVTARKVARQIRG